MQKSLLLIPIAVTALALGFATGLYCAGNGSGRSASPEIELTGSQQFNWDNEQVKPIPQLPPQAKQVSAAEKNSSGMAAPSMSGSTHRKGVVLAGSKASDPIPPEGRIVRDEQGVEVISKVYQIDKKYRSMRGPWGQNQVQFLEVNPPELIWITGAHVEMVAEDGQTKMPEQFMCHANFDLDREAHNDALRMNKPLDERLFTLSQGQLHVQFPEGCGIPMMSNESISLITQVLNLNIDNPEPFQVRHKVRINFVREENCSKPMKPLYEAGCSAMKSLEDRSLVYDYLPEGAPTANGLLTSMCSPGKTANEHNAHNDRLGRKFTGHWIVKPGREENRTRVTTLLNLTADTTVHHIAVHLHPFAESLELRDLTADETVFFSNAQNLEVQIGLARVDSFSSEEGLVLVKGHEYELISRYNNTSEDDQDSMAVMYMYLFDRDFQKPDTSPQPPQG